MWPFSKSKFSIPADCDFQLVRDEWADVLRTIYEDAAAKGSQIAIKKEFIDGWNQFAAEPCRRTAEEWLKKARGSDAITSFFVKCSPGGEIYSHRELQKEMHGRPDDFSKIDSIVKMVAPEKRPTDAIKLCIFYAVFECFNATKQHIDTDPNATRPAEVFLINCEYFYFFMHLANRFFYTRHGEAIGNRWQRDLAPTFISDFLDSMVELPRGQTLPPEMKDRVRAELQEKLHCAETEYAACKCLYPEKDDVFGSDALFAKLASNVAAIAGITNPARRALILTDAIQVFTKSGLEDRVGATALSLKQP